MEGYFRSHWVDTENDPAPRVAEAERIGDCLTRLVGRLKQEPGKCSDQITPIELKSSGRGLPKRLVNQKRGWPDAESRSINEQFGYLEILHGRIHMVNPQPALARSKTAATPLSLVSPGELFSDIKGLVHTIAARAYELFESRGREHGRDWEDWFRAEGELLRPVDVKLKESTKAFVARVDLAGFRPENIRVSLEPLCMRMSAQSSRKRKREVDRSSHSPKQGEHVFRVVALPANVNTSRATATFEEGVLEVVVPRATVEGGHRDSLSSHN